MRSTIVTGIPYTYAAPGLYTAFIFNCCRTSTNLSNPNGNYLVEAVFANDIPDPRLEDARALLGELGAPVHPDDLDASRSFPFVGRYITETVSTVDTVRRHPIVEANTARVLARPSPEETR